jgi:hypothetical protein
MLLVLIEVHTFFRDTFIRGFKKPGFSCLLIAFVSDNKYRMNPDPVSGPDLDTLDCGNRLCTVRTRT